MSRYGQTLVGWGPLSAPQLFTGEAESYSYRDAATKQNIDGAASNYIAMALHSQKAEIEFRAKVTSNSNDFLNLSAGASIAVDGIAGGVILCRRAVETWRLMQPKVASIQATHYPDMLLNGGGSAGTLDAATPAQALLGVLFPGGELTYSTFGFTHASGVVHGVTIEQILRIVEDDPSPDGKILGADANGYERTMSLDLLATAAAPAVKSVLTLVGAPGHGSDYRIERSEKMFEMAKGVMYRIAASWIPPFTGA